MSWVKISEENNYWLDTDSICGMWAQKIKDAEEYWIKTKYGDTFTIGHPEWWYLLGMKEGENKNEPIQKSRE